MKDEYNMKDQELNASFDEWLRDMKPPKPEFCNDMDGFLENLQDKMHADGLARKQRRQRELKRGSGVMALAIVCVLTFNLAEVGSDAFEMVVVENVTDPEAGLVVENKFRGGGFNLIGDQSQHRIDEMSQQIAAREGKVVELEGWEAGGKVIWQVTQEYVVGGEKQDFAFLSKIPKSQPDRRFAGFLNGEWPALFSKINNGELHPVKHLVQTVDNVDFSVDCWSINCQEYGEIKYYKGTTIR